MSLFFSFDGRIGRSTLFLGFLAYVGVTFVVSFLVGFISGSIEVIDTFFSLWFLFSIWPLAALMVKRWHDRDKSGWWLLILFIPIISWFGLFELVFLPGDPRSNTYGHAPGYKKSTALPN